ncbi:MAG TPA: hypothetical protein VFE33_17980 [Thermoanaerobaculia bacterium]|nr:hypothetical protein [Thermoanaerobaculia bacterium]
MASPNRPGCLFHGTTLLLATLSLAAIAAVTYTALLVLQNYPHIDLAATVRTHPALQNNSNLDGIAHEALAAFHSGLDTVYYFGMAVWRGSLLLLLPALLVGFLAPKTTRPTTRCAPAVWAATLLATGLTAERAGSYFHRFVAQPKGHFDVGHTRAVVSHFIVAEQAIPWGLLMAGALLVALNLGLLLSLRRLWIVARGREAARRARPPRAMVSFSRADLSIERKRHEKDEGWIETPTDP